MNAAILCSLLLTPAQETKLKLDFPQSPLPMVGFATAGKAGKLVTISVKGGGEIRVQPYQRSVAYTKLIEKDGKEYPITATKNVTQKRLVYHGMKMEVAGTMREPPVFGYPREKRVPYKIEECRFYDLHGKPVEKTEVVRRLTKRMPILIVADEKRVEPFYRAALNQEMLQFVPPLADEKQTHKGPRPK